MPLQATSGAASYDAFGGGTVAKIKYIEDYFSTFLYSGAGTTQVINNGIDLSTNGGLVWLKDRGNVGSHRLVDTVRGNRSTLFSESTSAAVTRSDDVSCDVSSFNTNGFTAGNFMNQASNNYVSWTFRKQPKFFDVVTYTGNSTARTIAHNLGSAPGCIIVKKTSASGNDWIVYHRSLDATKYIYLNTTAASGGPFDGYWNNTEPTSTVFSLGINNAVNEASATYVAYLFAHDAGGFGLTGTDNVISCGSYTGSSSSDVVVNLGYEPQWVMIKKTNGSDSWMMFDSMRGLTVKGRVDAYLKANVSDAENQAFGPSDYLYPTATGFALEAGYGEVSADGFNYIYIAIRRGPMKVPTSGTSVFNTLAHTGDAGGIEVTGVGFPPDLFISKWRSGISGNQEAVFLDRLRGTGRTLFSNGTGIEDDNSFYIGALGQDGVKTTTAQNAIYNKTGDNNVWWFMKRAPSFFDEVCYTGVNSGDLTLNHNLSVPYEMLIIKRRSGVGTWFVLHSGLTDATKYIRLNTVTGELNAGVTVRDSTNTTFLAPSGLDVTVASSTYVAWLFATCAGVSKVGSYTGNGTTQTINCGFGAGGARFVLLKRTDDASGWYVYDTVRGMTTLTDPYLFLNSSAGEVATLGSVTTVSTGFALDSTILAAINVSGGSYIFLAIS